MKKTILVYCILPIYKTFSSVCVKLLTHRLIKILDISPWQNMEETTSDRTFTFSYLLDTSTPLKFKMPCMTLGTTEILITPENQAMQLPLLTMYRSMSLLPLLHLFSLKTLAKPGHSILNILDSTLLEITCHSFLHTPFISLLHQPNYIKLLSIYQTIHTLSFPSNSPKYLLKLKLNPSKNNLIENTLLLAHQLHMKFLQNLVISKSTTSSTLTKSIFLTS